MEPLGFFGIIKLSSEIVRSNLKHFLCILGLFVIPNVILLCSNAFPYGNLGVNLASLLRSLQSIAHGNPNPDPQPYPPSDFQSHVPLSLLLAVSFFSFFFTLMVIVPVITISVCRAVCNKGLSFTGSLQAVRRCAANLLLTVLYEFGLLFALYVAASILIMITAIAVYQLGKSMEALTWVLVLWAVILIGLFWFIGIQWSLATTVAIVEEKRGWTAITRSMYLLDGSKKVVFGLQMAALLCQMILPWAGTESSWLWRWSCVLVSFSVQVVIGLFSMTCMVVLYMSCKARVKEPVDSLIPLSAQFGPQMTSSAKYVDLESAKDDMLL